MLLSQSIWMLLAKYQNIFAGRELCGDKEYGVG
jgi:hypothetical protein